MCCVYESTADAEHRAHTCTTACSDSASAMIYRAQLKCLSPPAGGANATRWHLCILGADSNLVVQLSGWGPETTCSQKIPSSGGSQSTGTTIANCWHVALWCLIFHFFFSQSLSMQPAAPGVARRARMWTRGEGGKCIHSSCGVMWQVKILSPTSKYCLCAPRFMT